MDLARLANLALRNIKTPLRPVTALQSRLLKTTLTRTITHPDGKPFDVLLPDGFSTRIYLGEVPEQDVQFFLQETVRPGDTVFDVGANIGYISRCAAQLVGTTGNVIAFEPMAPTYAVLEKNAVQSPQIQPRDTAIGSYDGMTLLNWYGTRFASQSSAYEPRVKPGVQTHAETLLLKQETIDSYVQHTGTIPDVIKLDIEGEELHALQGAKETLAHHHPAIIFEGGDCARTQTNTTASCLKYLQEHDYTIFEYADNNLKTHECQTNYCGNPNFLALYK